MRSTRALTTRLVVLASLCGLAIASGGCADGGLHGLTGPSGGTATSNRAVEASAEAGVVPFHGSLETTETETGSFPFLSVTLEGRGRATHLGDFTLASAFQLDLRTVTGHGSLTFTAANGDRLSADISGHGTIANGVVTIVENAVITGGTGRFANAAGEFTTHRSLVQATNTSSGSFDGTVDLHP